MTEIAGEAAALPEPVEMPMFPLGSVLFPDGVLPLHIFEPRFQQLLNHALEADRRFGVVLISRGSEVGGGEIRNDFGTIARIDEHQRFDDGRAAVISRGTNRLQVLAWLDDAPYPRARVQELLPEPEGPDDQAQLVECQAAFDRFIDLGVGLGRLRGVTDVEWLSELDPATWELAERGPFTSLDRYKLLAASSRTERLQALTQLLDESYADLALLGNLDQP